MARDKLAFIVSDKNGRIEYDGERLNPFVFFQTFLSGGGSFFDKSDGYKRVKDCTVAKHMSDEDITRLVIELKDPLEAIRLRRKGYVWGEDIVSSVLGACDIYKNKRTGVFGYVRGLEREQLKFLDKIGIKYEIVQESKK